MAAVSYSSGKPDSWAEEDGGWEDAVKSCKYGLKHHIQYTEYESVEKELTQRIESLIFESDQSGEEFDKCQLAPQITGVVETILHQSQYVVRIQRKLNDPNRDKNHGPNSSTSETPGGSGTGIFVYAGHSRPSARLLQLAMCTCKTMIKVDRSGVKFASVIIAPFKDKKFVSQSDPRAFRKLKDDIKYGSFILTNNHVILSEYEAQSACADFFLTSPDLELLHQMAL